MGDAAVLSGSGHGGWHVGQKKHQRGANGHVWDVHVDGSDSWISSRRKGGKTARQENRLLCVRKEFLISLAGILSPCSKLPLISRPTSCIVVSGLMFVISPQWRVPPSTRISCVFPGVSHGGDRWRATNISPETTVVLHAVQAGSDICRVPLASKPR